MKHLLSIGLILLFSSCVHQTKPEEKALELWYTQPATDWMREALPIGNAYLAAMTFGGITGERIQFNEESLWAGGPGEWDGYNGGNRKNAHLYLPKVRQLLDEGRFEEAHELANRELTSIIHENPEKKTWEGFGAYQCMGDIFVIPDHGQDVSDYKRSLNISEAVSEVFYEVDGIQHHRQYFASYPKRVLVFRFENNAENGIDYQIQQTTEHKNVTFWAEGNQLIMSGTLENNGMAFESRLLIDTNGSDISISKNSVLIQSATQVTLYLTAATDYLNKYPDYKGRDYQQLNHQTIAAVSSSSYEDIFSEQQQDYSSLFDRVTLELPGNELDTLPTDQRLIQHITTGTDHALEALYFQYGRYLLISSSRPGSLPANLQGKWNDSNSPPWACDYHANINIQMIYWPAEITNLAECHEPLVDYIDKLRPPGRKSAQEFFNADGWIVNTMNNVFGFTAPGWDFPWGFFPGGAAWYAQHVWEHYQFQPNETYLKETAFPIMKEAAQFWLDYLTEDDEGHLVSAPSYSPEHGGISQGAFMDIEMVWDLFSNCLDACQILGIEDEFQQSAAQAKAKLLPLKIGRWGQLQEWKEDVDDPQNTHRHISHMFALHPGKQISPSTTPELAEAAKVSLEARGDGGTGWSIAWKINFWARLLDGNRAYKLLRRAMEVQSQKVVTTTDGGIYPNLLSTHPPFQLDGNMGATSGIAEMLIQSQNGFIHLLPALPDAWSEGRVEGLKARGNFTVDMEWTDGDLTDVTIHSLGSAKAVKLKYGPVEREIELHGETLVKLNGNLE